MKDHYDTDLNSTNPPHHHDNKLTLHLKEEQLDISKQLVKTGEVTAYKETLIKEKTFTVPVTCEYLIIEKKNFNNKNNGVVNNSPETIRIPLSEEQIDIKKHKVVFEDVNIYKHQILDNHHIEEILKKENLYVKTQGNPTLIEDTLDSLS